ncbi:MAG: tRNA glutamyl-Q(34) synthetase GluQRS [Myxococcota bacterium]
MEALSLLTDPAYRTRYAPSPTGAMHLGHARTALIAFARARQAKGRILMRIEDLDGPRVREGAEAAILRDHEWLGLHWDEGPIHQSARTHHYDAALEALGEHVFACSCTRKEIAIASAPHPGEGGPRYPGTCRNGPTRAGRPLALRFRMDDAPAFEDGWQGAQHAAPDDFVVRRSDGQHAYQLAVVVDDADAAITEVVRGDDLLDSTPKQIALYRALGLSEPAWLHVPLVRNQEGARLSKRDGAVGIADYREAGWTPEAVIGALAASLGFRSGDPLSLDEFIAAFSIPPPSGGFNVLPNPR